MTWFGDAIATLKALDQLAKRYRAWRNPPVASRFIRLFESHGIHRNQISRFIGHDLTLKDVQDDASLLAKIDEPLLEAVCERFAVRREWLDGAEPQILAGEGEEGEAKDGVHTVQRAHSRSAMSCNGFFVPSKIIRN